MASGGAYQVRSASKPVYIVGEGCNIQRCISYLSRIHPTTGKESDIWNVHRNVQFGKELLHNVRMAKLKEQALDSETNMDYEDLDLNSDSIGGKRDSSAASCSSQQGSHKMKRLKVDDSSQGDIGYESDNTDYGEDVVAVTIHCINIEKSTWTKRSMASFIFQFVRQGVIVLAIDCNNFEQQYYVDIIKELGVRASLTTDGYSNLLVVDVTKHMGGKVDEETKKRIRKNIANIQSGTFRTYFGDHFDSCEVDELSSKLQELLFDSDDHQDDTSEKSIDELFKTKCLYSIFLVNSKPEEVAVLGEQKAIMCFTCGNKDYLCRPENLANAFLAILHKMQSMKYKLDLSTFLSYVDEAAAARNICIKAFEAAGLIRINISNQVHLLPLISPDNLPVFDEMEYAVETSTLRLTVNIDILPVFVRINIVMKILSLDWELKSSGPPAYKAKYAFLFTNGPMGLLVQFESSNQKKSYICLSILRLSDTKASVTTFDSSMCETLRHEIESEIETFRSIQNTNGGCVPVCEKHIRRKENHAISITEYKDWIDVALYIQGGVPMNDANVMTLLSPWFISLGKQIEYDMNRHFADRDLTKIAKLFGYGYRLFFIEEGIPSETVDQIDMPNQKEVSLAIFKLLQEWKKLKGTRANFTTLRSALERSSQVTVNLHAYDDIVEQSKVSQNQ